MKVRDTESWKSCNLVDSVIDLSTVGAAAQKTLAGLRSLRGDKFTPLGWAWSTKKLTPLMTLEVFKKMSQDAVSQTHVGLSTLLPESMATKDRRTKGEKGKPSLRPAPLKWPEAPTAGVVAKAPKLQLRCTGNMESGKDTDIVHRMVTGQKYTEHLFCTCSQEAQCVRCVF